MALLATVPITITLADTAKFTQLLAFCAEIFNSFVDWSLANNSVSKKAANTALYDRLRVDFPTVPSAFLQSTRDVAMESVKSWRTNTKKALAVNIKRERQNLARAKKGLRPLKLRKLPAVPRQRPTAAIRYDARTLTKRGDQLTLSTIGKREKLLLRISEHHRQITDDPAWKIASATVGYGRRIGKTKSAKTTDTIVIKVVYKKAHPADTTESGVLGVDLGVKNMATTSDGMMFGSAVKRAAQRRHMHVRKTCRAKGTRASKRRLRARSGREKRFSRDVDHWLAKQLSVMAVAIFAIEDLTDIRDQDSRGRQMNKWLGSWTFAQFRVFLTYKATKLGKRVLVVDPRFTSQKCSVCGHIAKKNRNGHQFKCRSCGFEAHADVNAAVNIRQAALLMLARQLLVPATAMKAVAMFRQAGVSEDEQVLLIVAAEKLSKKKRSKAPRTTRSCPSVVSAGELCAEAGVGIS